MILFDRTERKYDIHFVDMIRALKQHKKSFVFGTILTVIVIVVTVTCVIIFGQQETQTKTITSEMFYSNEQESFEYYC